MPESRNYPQHPLLAVSTAIFRAGKVLVVRRARAPALNLYTLPGGIVELGEALHDALIREIREETALEIKPLALAGHREIIKRDDRGQVENHFVILCFAARWVSGEPQLNDELNDARWINPSELKHLATTEGLSEIIDAAKVYLNAP